jgi:hypothetical protein
VSDYFHPGAEAEHFEAIAFFESRQLGLGAAYLSELEELMTIVAHVPHRYDCRTGHVAPSETFCVC